MAAAIDHFGWCFYAPLWLAANFLLHCWYCSWRNTDYKTWSVYWYLSQIAFNQWNLFQPKDWSDSHIFYYETGLDLNSAYNVLMWCLKKVGYSGFLTCSSSAHIFYFSLHSPSLHQPAPLVTGSFCADGDSNDSSNASFLSRNVCRARLRGPGLTKRVDNHVPDTHYLRLGLQGSSSRLTSPAPGVCWTRPAVFPSVVTACVKYLGCKM